MTLKRNHINAYVALLLTPAVTTTEAIISVMGGERERIRKATVSQREEKWGGEGWGGLRADLELTCHQMSSDVSIFIATVSGSGRWTAPLNCLSPCWFQREDQELESLSLWCRHIKRSAEAWLRTNGIGLDPCFINTEKTWHYVIAAAPVVISDFRHSSWEMFFVFFVFWTWLSPCNLMSLCKRGHFQYVFRMDNTKLKQG